MHRVTGVGLIGPKDSKIVISSFSITIFDAAFAGTQGSMKQFWQPLTAQLHLQQPQPFF